MNALNLASIDTFRNQIIETDALTLCRSLPPGSVDLILTDPPYGTTACSWDMVVPFADMWAAFKRVMKPRGAVVMTASDPFTPHLKLSNFDWFRYTIIWRKGYATDFLNSGRKPLKIHEDVLIFYNEQPVYNPQYGTGKPYRATRGAVDREYLRDKKAANNTVTINSGLRMPTTVLYFPNEVGKHPTQKPVALFEYLIKTYTRPGALVLDPFAGSGTTAVAAKITGRDFICGDITPEYVELARRRVNPEFGKAPKRVREPEPLTDLPLFAGV